MTATEQRPDRPPVRARSGRRPIPPLIFLLVLALAALGVWYSVLQQDADRQAADEETCSSSETAIPALDPSTVSVRVLNASDLGGRAGLVADALEGRGFTIAEVGNDGTSREVTGSGEVRHGLRGRDAARFLALQQPGITLYQDTRATATVDLVIGPEWNQLASQQSIADALAESAESAEAPSDC